MAEAREVTLVALFVVALCLSAASTTEALLRVGFYADTCRDAELIVKQEVDKAVKATPGTAAGLLRMHFHDCFVRGCDGSVLIDSTSNNTAEKDAIPNTTLHGFEVIDSAKKRLETVCKGKVSCADILAFAARDSVDHYRGVTYQVPAGRRDGKISNANDTLTNLPPPFLNLTSLLPFFTSKGLNLDDLIILSGAHTIGIGHCPSFSSRLYNFSAKAGTDPSLNPKYAAQLKAECPPGSNNAVVMDPSSPTTFDVNYYKNLLVNRGLFTSDQTLMSTRTAAAAVRKLAYSPELFKKKFAAAMVKMGNIGVLTKKYRPIITVERILAQMRSTNPKASNGILQTATESWVNPG